RAFPALSCVPAEPHAAGGHHRPRRHRGCRRALSGRARPQYEERGMSPLLDVRNLTTCFTIEGGEFAAVDGVSFSLESGRTLGIVGESGCGKSVTSLSIMGLVPQPPGRIAAGEILFEGTDLRRLPAAAMRELRGNRISMIFQEPMTSL